MNQTDFTIFFQNLKNSINENIQKYPLISPESFDSDNEEKYKIILLESYRIRGKFSNDSLVYQIIQLLLNVCELRANMSLSSYHMIEKHTIEKEIIQKKNDFRNMIYQIMTNDNNNDNDIEKKYILYLHSILY
jgi:hypothetical protein